MVSKDLVKRLSHSSEQSIRDTAIDDLEKVLKSNEIKFEDVELRSIFEGIFYCYWHSDKPKYQDALAKRITKFTHLVTKDEEKFMWIKYFFKCLALHWDKIDNWRINKFLSLIRKQLDIVFGHIKSKWEKDKEILTQYMDVIYQEALKEADVPLGIGMQMADIYIEEMVTCFDKSTLTQDRVAKLLNPFLQALGKIKQISLFQRIKEKVFLKLIESNGVDADEEGELYLPKFDIIQYAEVEMFEIASANDTLESRRNEIYELYEKAAGKEKEKAPELSYAERLRLMRMNTLNKPKTKHQKKKFLRDKVKKVKKIKKRIIKMLHNQHLQTLQGIPGEEEDSKIEFGSSDLLAALNANVVAKNGVALEAQEVKENGTHHHASNGEDTVIDISAVKPKKKSKKRKAEIPSSKLSGKKVVFELEKNKTKEFYMHGKVGLKEYPKSKELKVDSPGIIKKSILKRKKKSILNTSI